MGSHLKKVDHVTYACAKGQIEKWAWFLHDTEHSAVIRPWDRT